MDSPFSRYRSSRSEAKGRQNLIAATPDLKNDEALLLLHKTPFEHGLDDRMISTMEAEAEAELVHEEFLNHEAALLAELRDGLDERLERLQQAANEARIAAEALHRKIQKEQAAMEQHRAEKGAIWPLHLHYWWKVETRKGYNKVARDAELRHYERIRRWKHYNQERIYGEYLARLSRIQALAVAPLEEDEESAWFIWGPDGPGERAPPAS
ncbi:hypothetical protein QBC47DRAFT_399341 [Echria macrotheca]|uniref:Uncharacterized protein n=1 Tax=Echria macrotheca TaxID=438768 RepID=A0AAJ0BJS3_9PEZI|nr:hypothetical protein QBC47DRAFT_399341 [Echria macrotheca]